MDISLTPQLKELVDKKVASGRYNSASEVIREARIFEEQDRLREIRLKALKEEFALGLDQLKRGESSLLERDTFKEIQAKGRKMLSLAKGKTTGV